MFKSVCAVLLCFSVVTVSSLPIGERNDAAGDSFPVGLVVTAAVALVVLFGLALPLCANWCQDGLMGVKVQDDAGSTYSGMDPPVRSTPGTPGMPRSDYNTVVDIEPLPDLGPRQPKPPGYNHAVNRGISSQDWQNNPRAPDLSRAQLQFLSEAGTGWFGRVVAAQDKASNRPCVVKILRDDATSIEKAFFLFEARPYRDLNHENVLKLVGKCIETEPYFLVLEHGGNVATSAASWNSSTDLKQHLLSSRGKSGQLIESGALLGYTVAIANGLQHMHENNMIHMDIACRNALIDERGRVRVGDYGTSATKYKEDYYILGDSYVPVRWWAPESFIVGGVNLTTRDVTKPANVWSFGVTLWEILEFAKQPFMNLTNTEVVEQVVKPQVCLLGEPVTPIPHRPHLAQIMQLCWSPDPNQRPTMDQVRGMLAHLAQYPQSPPDSDFDAKWAAIMHGPKASDDTHVPPDPVTTVHAMPHVHATSAPLDSVPALPAEPVGKEKEREEKRSFILSLSEADLAALSTSELVEFYEYLSADEITALEARHRAVLLKAEEARSRDAKRQHFLNMSLADMNGLNQDQLKDYMQTLSSPEKDEVEGRLAKRREAARMLQMTSEELANLKASDLDTAAEFLGPEELEHLQQRIAQAQESMRRAEEARKLLMSTDSTLARSSDADLSAAMAYLSPGDQEQLRGRREQLREKQRYILGCSGDSLLDMDEATFDGYLELLGPDQTVEVESKRNEAANARREIEERRRLLLDATDDEILRLAGSPDWDGMLSVLSPEERHQLSQRLEALRPKPADEVVVVNEMAHVESVPQQQAPSLSDQVAAPEYDSAAQKPEEAVPPVVDEVSVLTEVGWTEAAPSSPVPERVDPALLAAKDDLLSACGYRLIELYNTVYNNCFPLLSTEEQSNIHMRVEDAQNRREEILELGPYELSQKPPEAVESFQASLSPEEWLTMIERLEDASNTRLELREHILNCDDVELYALSQVGLDAYRPYLSEEEALLLDQRIADFDKIRRDILNSEDPSDFGDEFIRKYLSPDEAEKLIEKKGVENEGQIRNEILNAQGMDLYKLYKDNWDTYFPYLTVEERAGIVQWVNQISTQRESFLKSTDEDLAKVPPEQMEGAEKYFSPEEYSGLRDRWESLQADKAKRRRHVLTIPDSELFDFVKTSEYDRVLPYLSSEEMLTIDQRVAAIESRRQRLLNSTDAELLDLPPDELRDMLMALPEEIRESLSKKVEGLRIERNAKRAVASQLTPLELALMPKRDFDAFQSFVTPESWREMKNGREEATEAREGALALLSSGDLTGFTEDTLARYKEFLSDTEYDDLISKLPKPELDPVPIPHRKKDVDTPQSSLRDPMQTSTPNDDEPQKRKKEGKPLPVPPQLSNDVVNLSSEMTGLGSLQGKEDYDLNRSRILSLSDAELLNMTGQYIESFYDFLGPNEIWQLQDRVTRLQSRPDMDFSEDESSSKAPLSRTSGLDHSDLDNSKLSLKAEHSTLYATPWEAREHILNMAPDELWNRSDELGDYYVYLTIAEQRSVDKKLKAMREQKRTDILHATNDELRGYTPVQLDKYMKCLSRYEQASVKSRLSHLNQLSVVSDSDVDIEMTKNPLAFKQYLAMTAMSSASMDNASDTNMSGDKMSEGLSLADELAKETEGEKTPEREHTPVGWLSESAPKMEKADRSSPTRGAPDGEQPIQEPTTVQSVGASPGTPDPDDRWVRAWAMHASEPATETEPTASGWVSESTTTVTGTGAREVTVPEVKSTPISHQDMADLNAILDLQPEDTKQEASMSYLTPMSPSQSLVTDTKGEEDVLPEPIKAPRTNDPVIDADRLAMDVFGFVEPPVPVELHHMEQSSASIPVIQDIEPTPAFSPDLGSFHIVDQEVSREAGSLTMQMPAWEKSDSFDFHSPTDPGSRDDHFVQEQTIPKTTEVQLSGAPALEADSPLTPVQTFDDHLAAAHDVPDASELAHDEKTANYVHAVGLIDAAAAAFDDHLADDHTPPAPVDMFLEDEPEAYVTAPPRTALQAFDDHLETAHGAPDASELAHDEKTANYVHAVGLVDAAAKEFDDHLADYHTPPSPVDMVHGDKPGAYVTAPPRTALQAFDDHLEAAQDVPVASEIALNEKTSKYVHAAGLVDAAAAEFDDHLADHHTPPTSVDMLHGDKPEAYVTAPPRTALQAFDDHLEAAQDVPFASEIALNEKTSKYVHAVGLVDAAAAEFDDHLADGHTPPTSVDMLHGDKPEAYVTVPPRTAFQAFDDHLEAAQDVPVASEIALNEKTSKYVHAVGLVDAAAAEFDDHLADGHTPPTSVDMLHGDKPEAYVTVPPRTAFQAFDDHLEAAQDVPVASEIALNENTSKYIHAVGLVDAAAAEFDDHLADDHTPPAPVDMVHGDKPEACVTAPPRTALQAFDDHLETAQDVPEASELPLNEKTSTYFHAVGLVDAAAAEFDDHIADGHTPPLPMDILHEDKPEAYVAPVTEVLTAAGTVSMAPATTEDWLSQQPLPLETVQQPHHEPTSEAHAFGSTSTALAEDDWFAKQPLPLDTVQQPHHEPTSEAAPMVGPSADLAEDDWLSQQPLPLETVQQPHHEPTSEAAPLTSPSAGLAEDNWLSQQPLPLETVLQPHHEPTSEAAPLASLPAGLAEDDWLSQQPLPLETVQQPHHEPTSEAPLTSPSAGLVEDDWFAKQPSPLETVEQPHHEPTSEAPPHARLSTDLAGDDWFAKQPQPSSASEQAHYEPTVEVGVGAGDGFAGVAPALETASTVVYTAERTDDDWSASYRVPTTVSEQLHHEPTTEHEAKSPTEDAWLMAQPRPTEVAEQMHHDPATEQVSTVHRTESDDWLSSQPPPTSTHDQLHNERTRDYDAPQMPYVGTDDWLSSQPLPSAVAVQSHHEPTDEPVDASSVGWQTGAVSSPQDEWLVGQPLGSQQPKVEPIDASAIGFGELVNEVRFEGQEKTDDLLSPSATPNVTQQATTESMVEVHHLEHSEPSTDALQGSMTYLSPRSPAVALDFSATGVESEIPPPVRSPTTGDNVGFFGELSVDGPSSESPTPAVRQTKLVDSEFSPSAEAMAHNVDGMPSWISEAEARHDELLFAHPSAVMHPNAEVEPVADEDWLSQQPAPTVAQEMQHHEPTVESAVSGSHADLALIGGWLTDENTQPVVQALGQTDPSDKENVKPANDAFLLADTASGVLQQTTTVHELQHSEPSTDALQGTMTYLSPRTPTITLDFTSTGVESEIPPPLKSPTTGDNVPFFGDDLEGNASSLGQSALTDAMDVMTAFDTALDSDELAKADINQNMMVHMDPSEERPTSALEGMAETMGQGALSDAMLVVASGDFLAQGAQSDSMTGDIAGFDVNGREGSARTTTETITKTFTTSGSGETESLNNMDFDWSGMGDQGGATFFKSTKTVIGPDGAETTVTSTADKPGGIGADQFDSFFDDFGMQKSGEGDEWITSSSSRTVTSRTSTDADGNVTTTTTTTGGAPESLMGITDTPMFEFASDNDLESQLADLKSRFSAEGLQPPNISIQPATPPGPLTSTPLKPDLSTTGESGMGSAYVTALEEGLDDVTFKSLDESQSPSDDVTFKSLADEFDPFSTPAKDSSVSGAPKMEQGHHW